MLPEELAVDLVRFERELNEFAAVLQLDLTRFSADHISLRCHQTSTAERWKTQILRIGTLLAENLINGRPICLFILNSAIKVGPWRIDCIELPWPGKNVIPMKDGSMWSCYCRAMRIRCT